MGPLEVSGNVVVRRYLVAASAVGVAEVVEEDADAPTVETDVVERGEEIGPVLAAEDKAQSEKRAGFQIEGGSAAALRQVR